VIAAWRAAEINSHPESQVHNSQPHGIGRVAPLGDLGAWSNLGRNVVFVGPDLRPRAVFDESVFADDELSQYDLDVHAVLALPRQGLIVTLNHLGSTRAFDRGEVEAPGPPRRVSPVWMRPFAADVERCVVVNGRLVGSGPRERCWSGLLVSEPLRRDVTAAPLELTPTLESFGIVSALTPLGGGRVVVGGESHVSAVAIDDDGAAAPLWDTAVEFEPAVLLWDGDRVWAAGSEAGSVIDDYDWEARHGGGFAALDPVDGRVLVRRRFDQDLAWGAGGAAVVIVPGLVCGLGRRGDVHLFETRDGAWVGATTAISEESLGIAHGALLGDHLVYGFNRGGYRLWALPLSELRRTT
jgi:hypothetical protein